MSGDIQRHPHKSDKPAQLKFSILTVSSSRGLDQDTSGDLIAELVRDQGHTILQRAAVADDIGRIGSALKGLIAQGPDIVIVDGGTGVTPKDVTVEAVKPMLEKEMGAFATLFATFSFEQIGAGAILSRACAGTIGKTAVFCVPGSSKACELAMNRIILPEAVHLMDHVRGTV